ncbi:virulence factor [Phaeovulum sp. NW3]|uniref:virulence factor n=1 Tax=Phaeovulum sp. NW3 TaxID=2934933 RepID=UPI002021970D|nr:virulence factor [Phaeovulum sp. NW3]MCL7463902.1 virulence factor [Phaeovulum sp. NW3]
MAESTTRITTRITIVCWRDIPAQVIAGQGRGAVKIALPERFEQAIDRCAMKVGARDADAYLAQWRKRPAGTRPGGDAAAAAAEVAQIVAEYDAARLARLIAQDGWDLRGADTGDTL